MAIEEIASDLYRISTYVPEINLQFNQFLVSDDELLLFHTGMWSLFPRVREDVARVIWEAGLMFEETQAMLLRSDLLTHQGNVESRTSSDVVGRLAVML